jgi:chorismate mutase
MIEANNIQPDDVASAIFTTTIDLNADYPALAARALGWHDVPLLCVREMDGSGGPPRCIRVLLHVETTRARGGMAHVYLAGARALRPDLAGDVPDA